MSTVGLLQEHDEFNASTMDIEYSILNVDQSKYFRSQFLHHSEVVTTQIFTTRYNCLYRICKYCGYYCFIVVVLCVVAGIVYAGQYVERMGAARDSYGHTFNINGTCLCVQSKRGGYYWDQTWQIQNLSVCDGVKNDNYTFASHSTQQWVFVGDLRPCYTNAECTRLFMTAADNVYIDQAIYLFVAAMLLFMGALGCLFGAYLLLNYLPSLFGISNVLHIGPKDMDDYYEIQWKTTMSAKQRFDYWMSYTLRELQLTLNDDVHELLLQFYNDDDDGNESSVSSSKADNK